MINATRAGTAAFFGFSIVKCKKGDPCDDLSNLTPEQLEERKGYNYVKESPYPTKKCVNCEFWLAPEGENSCGACGLFEGPIHLNGYCDEWVLMES